MSDKQITAAEAAISETNKRIERFKENVEALQVQKIELNKQVAEHQLFENAEAAKLSVLMKGFDKEFEASL